jgi:uncharacterized membrane protein YphA (DoxX/SURF4 family)
LSSVTILPDSAIQTGSAFPWKANIDTFVSLVKTNDMTQKASSKVLHISLWAVQILLAASLFWAGSMKLFQPVQKLSAMWPWTGQVDIAWVKFTGIIDLVGALGLILPALFRKPFVVPVAAVLIVVLMICAAAFHIVRGEASQIGVNVVFGILAAFIVWGRFRK